MGNDYNIAFFDFETRCPTPIEHGTHAYTLDDECDVLALGWILPDGTEGIYSPPFYWERADEINDDLTPLFDFVADGGVMCAWNARFDRHVWNNAFIWQMQDLGVEVPDLALEQVICAQAQGEANNLPAGLGKAAQALRCAQKQSAGKALINMLSIGGRGEWKANNAIIQRAMQEMRDYCVDDNRALRDVFNMTRPLTPDEWAQYHTSERINDRGARVDVEYATAAQRYAEAELQEVNTRISTAALEPGLTTHTHLRNAQWLYDTLANYPELQDLVIKSKPDAKKLRLSAAKPVRAALYAALNSEPFDTLVDLDTSERVIEFLNALEDGNATAANKFKAMALQQVDGILYGQYTFNGAGQTGRFSSRGVQVHNLTRAMVDKNDPDAAIDVIEDVLDGVDAPRIVDRFGLPISRLLAATIRPAFRAREGRVLVWADWEQIEARVLPWLSNSEGGRRILEAFARGEDIYVIAAAGIYNKPEEAITSSERQVGKVAVLALGFGGGVGAFKAMAAGYGVAMSAEQMEEIVRAWREANAWAVTFWDCLRDAVNQAVAAPGVWARAGRLRYIFANGFLCDPGSLICELPCGRWLVYPGFDVKRYRITHDDKTVFEGTEAYITLDDWADEGASYTYLKGFSSGWARVKFWHGIAAENATQGYAGSILRDALGLAEGKGLDIVLHTHDEIVSEVDEGDEQRARDILTDCMTNLTVPTDGLPLGIDIEHGPYYTKV